MFNFLPSPPSPMSHSEKLLALLTSPSVARKQKKIRSLAQSLLKEVSEFLEFMVEGGIVVPGTRRELPNFFVKSYNELKRMAKEIGHEDAYLNFLPNGLKMQVLTELGPSVSFPKTVAEYFLEDRKSPLVEEINSLQEEVVFFLRNSQGSSPQIEELPVFFHLTVKAIQQRAEKEDITEEEKNLVGSIHGKIQKTLEDSFPRKVREYLVDDSVYAHNMDI